MDVALAVTEVVDLLSAAGLPATADPRDLDPPGVLVGMPTVDLGTLSGACWVGVFPVLVIGPNVGRQDALDALGGLLQGVLEVLNARTATPTEWPNPGGGDPLPAYAIDATVSVED
jgi:hypothetical protein